MNKINCDVCGTAYPESAAQCPICGCVRSAEGTVSSDSINLSSGNGSYSYVKGGRFSRSNVKKRNQGMSAQEQEMPEFEDAVVNERPEESVKTDRGLIIAVCVLLLAIVAVVIYIVTRFFAPDPAATGEDGGYEKNPAGEGEYETFEPEGSEPDDILPTEVTIPEVVPTEPTQPSQPSEPTQPTQPMGPSEPTQPTKPDTNPEKDYSQYVKPFKTNKENYNNHVLLKQKTGFGLKLKDATGKVMDVDWQVEDPTICSVKGNIVTGLKVGTTTIFVVIDGTTYSCIVEVY